MSAKPIAAEVLELLEESREHARYLGELGVEAIALGAPVEHSKLSDAAPLAPAQTAHKWEAPPRIEPPPKPPAKPAGSRSVTSQQPASSASLFGEPSPVETVSKSNERLEDIWRDIGECTRCGLCEGRTQVVNTHGNHKARLMFVGEAPGADEDAQGKPFVGRAGQLLTKIIEAIGLKREEVLIGNVNRCRPPGNRQPTLEEAAICRPFLFREIASVQPEVIVVMGNTAVRNLLETREGITRIRGKFQDFRGIKVMPTFHPAYLLRDPSKKRETWEDLKKVRDYLDGVPPQASES